MALLASIDERLALMPLIAETKRSGKREIEDQKREEKVIREATVKTHLGHVYEKLGVSSRSAAVAAARAQGLVR